MEVLRRSSVLAAEIMDAFDRSPTDKELVAQAKALGREFVHARLLRAGLSWSAPERAAPVPGGRLAEVCAVLLRLVGDRGDRRLPGCGDPDLLCRHHVGQGCVSVLRGRGAGRGLCAAGPARPGARPRRLSRGVCTEDAGNLAAEAWWMDVLKCVVSTDPGLRSHWLVAALCSFGRFLKAAFFMLLPER
ncbi:bcl-2-related ovarian killer protein isoform X12 [Ovis canadensis]|uniref:bcl-2-related ovarian killer protein isoform X12 n=1 Tax=Ovis canadensis TaxID=37174 RepID=UPI003752AEC8